MAVWRTLGSVVVALAAAGSAVAQQKYPLAETPQAGDCAQIQIRMDLTGTQRFTQGDKTIDRPLGAQAVHEFPERVLVVGKGVPQKVARVYEKAQAQIRNGDVSVRTLRPDRTLLVVQRSQDRTLVYCPTGSLTHEELELTHGHFDTLALGGLLPGQPVAVKETWKVPTEAAQALCQFEGVIKQDLTCTLEEVNGNTARVAVAGTVEGIDLGAQIKATVTAGYQFDLNSQRLVALEWKQQDKRGQGPASPASEVETVYTLKRAPISQPEKLSDVALISVPPNLDEPPAPIQQLLYRDPKRQFDLLYARDWQVVEQSEKRLVMRLLDRGDFLAQVWVTPWAKAAPGKHLSPQEFQKVIEETPGWKQEKVLQSEPVPTEPGRYVYRITAYGQLDGIDVIQNSYLVVGPGGEQAVLVFVMTKDKADKLGSRDLSLVGSLELTPEK